MFCYLFTFDLEFDPDVNCGSSAGGFKVCCDFMAIISCMFGHFTDWVYIFFSIISFS